MYWNLFIGVIVFESDLNVYPDTANSDYYAERQCVGFKKLAQGFGS